MYFKLCFYIANATNVFLSSILDIPWERGIRIKFPHLLTIHGYMEIGSVVSPVLRSSRLSVLECYDIPYYLE